MSALPPNVAFVRGRWRESIARVERFEQKISPEPMSGCWLWTGAGEDGGYGNFGWSHGETEKAHRAAWRLFVGEIRSGLCVCHRCDNRRCVNPSHLFLGTKADNAADMVRKGRQRPGHTPGVKNGRAKITPADVLAIRAACALGANGNELGRRYGLSGTAIRKIAERKLWKSVPE